MPEVRKAQLIEGIVHMPSPVRADLHAEADGLLHGWLFHYALQSPDVKFYPNTTLVLDADNTLQPDAILCAPPRRGGRVWLNDKGYLCGAPELVCEVAASSAAVDLHDKFRAYRRDGIAEYLVWIVREKRIRWFALEEQEYVEMTAASGLLKSRSFPGLVLDTKAAARMDRAKIIATLEKHLGASR